MGEKVADAARTDGYGEAVARFGVPKVDDALALGRFNSFGRSLGML